MKLDDLKSTWQSEMQVTDDLPKVQESLDAIAQVAKERDLKIVRRDRIELAACVILAVVALLRIGMHFFVEALDVMSFLGWVTMLVASIFIPFKLSAARKFETRDLDCSQKAYLEQERDKLNKQVILLQNIAYWYVSPLMLSIFFVTYGAQLENTGTYTIEPFLAGYYVSCVAFAVFMIYLNKRAVKKKLEPEIDSIERALEELNGFENEEG